MWTNDGVPDLVLSFSTHTVVIEVKTESDEHLVPSGNAQTVAYPDAVRSKLRLDAKHPVYMVFLTPDCRPAENPEAICTSFAHFALQLAKGLSATKLINELRFVFSMSITQLAKRSLSSIEQIVSWKAMPTDELMVRRANDISQLARLLVGEQNV